jgi:hypothetical protein
MGAAQRQHPFYGKGQEGRAGLAIYLWWFPLFCAAEKPEKYGICAKIVQQPRAGHLGE